MIGSFLGMGGFIVVRSGRGATAKDVEEGGRRVFDKKSAIGIGFLGRRLFFQLHY